MLLESASFNHTIESNKQFFDAFWYKNDIQIDGDLINQQGIRFCLFQLIQTYQGLESNNNIGAKGLTGEAYSGHAFWDSETYCLPYYLFSNPKAAYHLLMFRYNTLNQARLRAKELDCLGAAYPIATLNGDEHVIYGNMHPYNSNQHQQLVMLYGIMLKSHMIRTS